MNVKSKIKQCTVSSRRLKDFAQRLCKIYMSKEPLFERVHMSPLNQLCIPLPKLQQFQDVDSSENEKPTRKHTRSEIISSKDLSIVAAILYRSNVPNGVKHKT